MVIDIDVRTRAFDRFAAFLPKEQLAVQDEMRRAFSAHFEGRVSWHVNTTSVGGGVAEMLRQHVAYGRGSGVDSRWVVISGGPEFGRAMS
jgi:trehalose synthase